MAEQLQQLGRPDGTVGILVFIVVYALATVIFAAVQPHIGAFAFGMWKGFLAAWTGAILETLAFLVARFVARDKIESIAKRNEKFRKIDNAIGKQGAKLIFLLRLSPVIPFNLSNYFYGLTAVKFWGLFLASWIGLSATFLYVYALAEQSGCRSGGRRRSDETWLAVLDVSWCWFCGHRYHEIRGYDIWRDALKSQAVQ